MDTLSRVENAIETANVFFYVRYAQPFIDKSIWRKHLWWENVRIVCMHILEYFHENLSQIRWKDGKVDNYKRL